MRWIRGAALAMGLAAGAAAAQPKPPPLNPPPAASGPAPAPADTFGLPSEAPPPSASPAPADEPAAVARFRALLGPGTSLVYRTAEPIDPAAGSVRLLGATLTREGSRLAIEALTLDAVRTDGLGAAGAREMVLTGPKGETTRIARMELRGLALPASDPTGIALDLLRLDGLTVEGGMPLAVAEAMLEDYAAGRPGRLTLGGLEVLTPGRPGFDRVRLGHVALRGLDLPATAAALQAGEAPPRPPGPYALEMEEVSVLQGDRQVGGFGTFRAEGAPPAGTLESGRVALRDLRLEPSPGLDEWLRRFGYAALLADLTAESRYDRATGRFELGSLSLAGREMGVLGLSLVLEGLTPEARQAKDWEGLRLAGLALRYRDGSLYGRAVRDQARRLRLPEARVREGFAAQAADALSDGPGRAAAAMAPVLAAVQRFLRGEARELEITARPPRPMPLGELPAALMGGPAEAQRVLGLGAAAR